MKTNIYFDNAATTPLHPMVLEAMMPYFTEVYGNASSIHAIGRKAKSAVESSRKKVADLMGTSPSEIFFTSGGTEANNTILHAAVNSLGVKNIISSPVEHHAVLHPLEFLEKTGKIEFQQINLQKDGSINFEVLPSYFKNNTPTLLSLMHGNNEVGNLLDLAKTAQICSQHNAYFHSDLVQTVGKMPINLETSGLDFASASAHKFYGPKGVGFMYIKAGNSLHPYISGGAQERNMRGGTENVAGIVGLTKALELAYAEMDERKTKITKLKKYFIANLLEVCPSVIFNGLSGDFEQSLYHLVNVSFPANPDNEMLLFNLDIEGICVSGGSACSSGTDIGSHVLRALNVPEENANVRFSFSIFNTKEEIDRCIIILKTILKV